MQLLTRTQRATMTGTRIIEISRKHVVPEHRTETGFDPMLNQHRRVCGAIV
jgi:hypothetical protein